MVVEEGGGKSTHGNVVLALLAPGLHIAKPPTKETEGVQLEASAEKKDEEEKWMRIKSRRRGLGGGGGVGGGLRAEACPGFCCN